MKLRINKLISDAGLGSRRDVEEYIKRGRVKINGRVAHLGDMVSEEDTVFFDEVDLPVRELIRDHIAEKSESRRPRIVLARRIDAVSVLRASVYKLHPRVLP